MYPWRRRVHRFLKKIAKAFSKIAEIIGRDLDMQNFAKDRAALRWLEPGVIRVSRHLRRELVQDHCPTADGCFCFGQRGQIRLRRLEAELLRLWAAKQRARVFAPLLQRRAFAAWNFIFVLRAALVIRDRA
jgi:hypothetical protein